jgi:hypothetical protein
VQSHSMRRQTGKSSGKTMLKCKPQTSILSNKDSEFSYKNWGKPMLCYLKSIKEM